MLFFKKKPKAVAFNKEIIATYTGTTLRMRHDEFFIHCTASIDGKTYEFISEALNEDPQPYIKKNKIKQFTVTLGEDEFGETLYDAYKVNINEIKIALGDPNEPDEY